MRSASASWWAMPGPERFVRDLAADLAAGRHVVVGLPPHTPPGLLPHLAHHARPGVDARAWQFPPAPHLAQDQSPAEWLWHYWKQGQPDDQCPFDLTPQQLARQADLPVGKRVVLTGLLPADWPQWLSFLVEYAQQAQQTTALRRTLFCLVVEDPHILADLPTRQDSQYRIHRYDGRCGQLDAHLYVAAHLLKPANAGPLSLVEEIQQELAALLFRTDPAAAVQVAELPTPDAYALQAVVESIAAGRQWPPAAPKPALGLTEQWAHGWIDQRHARAWRHPGAPHAITPRQRAEMALWQAQVRVLLPWIEQRRREVLVEPAVDKFLKGKLPRTFERQHWKGDATNRTYHKEQVDRLELGFITELFWEGRHELDAGLRLRRQKFEALKTHRDQLSHLKTLSWQEVESLALI